MPIVAHAGIAGFVANKGEDHQPALVDFKIGQSPITWEEQIK